MVNGYYLIIAGTVAITWTMAMLLWRRRNPDERVPSILLAGPIATGVLAVAAGAAQLIRP